MAAITISFNTTAKQDAKLARMLTWVNANRTTEGLQPFADVEAYGRAVLVEAFQSWVKQQDERDNAGLTIAYNTADPAVQAQVDALLPR